MRSSQCTLCLPSLQLCLLIGQPLGTLRTSRNPLLVGNAFPQSMSACLIKVELLPGGRMSHSAVFLNHPGSLLTDCLCLELS